MSSAPSPPAAPEPAEHPIIAQARAAVEKGFKLVRSKWLLPGTLRSGCLLSAAIAGKCGILPAGITDDNISLVANAVARSHGFGVSHLQGIIDGFDARLPPTVPDMDYAKGYGVGQAAAEMFKDHIIAPTEEPGS